MNDYYIPLECAECGDDILPDEPKLKYDGDWCHLDCAADAEDEAFFDRDFGDS